MNRYRAVIFDLDGVITDTARYHYLAWKRLADSLAIAFDEHFNERLKGVDRTGSLELILASAGRHFSAEDKRRLADSKNLHYQELIAVMTPADLLPGALDALGEVRARGLRTGLASVSRNAFQVIERLGIRDCFDYVVDAALVANSKPHPEIFLTAAETLGVAPSECLGVEDAVAGIASIKRAGMRALGVGDPAVLVDADVVIPSLAQFRLDDY
jgi:beta-phosphoglucomutase